MNLEALVAIGQGATIAFAGCAATKMADGAPTGTGMTTWLTRTLTVEWPSLLGCS